MDMERYLPQEDASALGWLAEQLLRIRDIKFNQAEKLVELIATSVLLPISDARPDCVTLYARTCYRPIGSDTIHRVQIVLPHEADDALGKISVLAPLAMSLIGRRVGSVLEVPLSFNRWQYVEIAEVRQSPQRDVAYTQRPDMPPSSGQPVR